MLILIASIAVIYRYKSADIVVHLEMKEQGPPVPVPVVPLTSQDIPKLSHVELKKQLGEGIRFYCINTVRNICRSLVCKVMTPIIRVGMGIGMELELQ